MRLITWNCFRGKISERLARLQQLKPDIVALQECEEPASQTANVIWRGSRTNQGVALVANQAPEGFRSVQPAGLPPTVVAAHANAPEPFVLVNIWAQPSPTYDEFVMDSIRRLNASFPERVPLLVVGDFNSTPLGSSGPRAHQELMRFLTDECGLVSAYHAHHGVETGKERHATHYWRWQENAPFHIDYVCIPLAWRPRLKSVDVGAFGDWRDSDHVPLVVELA